MRLATTTIALRQRIDALIDALADPARRERQVLFVLAGYTAIWTLYGVFAKASQNIHFDMSELVGWSRELSLGYPKHPPLAAYIVRIWFSIFPSADWAYYLLAIALAALALWFAWKIAGDYLDPEKRIAALALLTLIPFYNFHALKFNVNTVLMPIWAAATWLFLRSFETRKPLYAVLAGIGAAAAMLGKYWSIFLLLGLAIATLSSARRAEYFRSSAPYLTILTGGLVIAPHVAWLVAHDFTPLTYAMAAHAPKTITDTILAALGYIVGAYAYAAAPVLLTLFVLRTTPSIWVDTTWPETENRRFIAHAFLLPIFLPAFFAMAVGFELTSLWTMSAWSLLPVFLLSSPQVKLTRRALALFVAIALAVPVVFTAAAPFIAFTIHKAGVAPAQAHARLLARQIARIWRETTDKPLRLIGGDGDLSYGAAFYMRVKPSGFPGLSRQEAPWVNDARIAREGMAMVCRVEDTACLRMVEARTASAPIGRREEVTLTRKYLGIEGAPQRYVIVTLPPR